MTEARTVGELLHVIKWGNVADNFMTKEQRQLEVSKTPLEIRGDPTDRKRLWVRLRSGEWVCIVAVRPKEEYQVTVESKGPLEFDKQ